MLVQLLLRMYILELNMRILPRYSLKLFLIFNVFSQQNYIGIMEWPTSVRIDSY